MLGVDDDFLNSLHVDVGDVSVAYGEHDMSSGAPMHLSVRAYRARGASAEDLVAYFRPIMQEQSEGIPLQRRELEERLCGDRRETRSPWPATCSSSMTTPPT